MFGAYGQNNATIDSLKTVLKTAKEDTAKVKSLLSLSGTYRGISDYEMSMQYADSALELSKTLNYKRGIATSYSHIGNNYDNQGKYLDALENLFASLKIYEEIGYKKGIARCFDSIGIVYSNMGNYSEALGFYWKSLKIFEEIGDKKGMSHAYNSIGVVYGFMGNYSEAEKNYTASLKISEEIGYMRGIATSYANIGLIYLNQGKYDQALENYKASLKIKEELGYRAGIAGDYTNIGEIFWKQDKFYEANKHFQSSLNISKEIGYKALTAYNYHCLGEVNIDLKKFQEARKYLKDGIALANEMGSKKQIMDNYASLSKLEQTEGNFEQALEYHNIYTRYKDTLYNEKSSNQIAQMKIQYESDKKDQEIELLNKNNELQEHHLEKQKILRNGMIAGAFFIVLVGFLSFRSFKLRKKLEKQEAIVQERHRISADLHDDVGSGLSKITLLSELLKTQAKTPENRKEAEKISNTALELSSTISEIIWALNSNNDYLENMVAYIRRYAAEYFEDSPVILKVVTQGKILPTPINGEHRRNIFYSVKEALNNILKHAEATEAVLKFVVIDDKLDVIISDNGKGLPDGDLNRFGNGINNMRDRMKNISGKFKIESHHGTRIILNVAI